MKHLHVSPFAIFIVLALAVVILVDVFCFSQLTITDQSLSPQLQKGDRVLINKLSPIHRGDIIAYKHPFNTSYQSSLGKVFSIPGDTLWVKVEEAGTYQWRPFLIPKSQKPIAVKPWNIKLLSNALHTFEGKNVCVDCDSSLVIDGVPQSKVTFQNDYIWVRTPGDSVVTDSRAFGLLPISSVRGVAAIITYSFQDNEFQPSRFFKTLN